MDPVMLEVGLRMYLQDLERIFARAFPARFFLVDETALTACRLGRELGALPVGGAR